MHVKGLDSDQLNVAVEKNHYSGEEKVIAMMLKHFLGNDIGQKALYGITHIRELALKEWTLWEDRALFRKHNRLFREYESRVRTLTLSPKCCRAGPPRRARCAPISTKARRWRSTFNSQGDG